MADENTAPKGTAKLKKDSSKIKPKAKLKYKPIPVALAQSHIDTLDAIGKQEEMSRSELIRKAIEHFVACYNADKLDERQSILLKQMKVMEKGLRSLLVKAIRVNGQVLYFETLPYTMGTPKQKLTTPGFQALYEKSANFAAQILQSKSGGKVPNELQADELQADDDIAEGNDSE